MSAPLQFDRPAPPGDQFACDTHVGALLVIEVLEYTDPIKTKASETPQNAIRANVFVIAAPGTVAESFHDTLLFPRVLVSRLRQSVGRMVLGVLTGQPGVKRDGKNVPYDLDDPQPGMEQAAMQAMTAYRMSNPAPAPAPQQQAWGQQPATQAPQQQQQWGQQPAQQPAQQPGGWQGQPQPPAAPPAQQAPAPYGNPSPWGGTDQGRAYGQPAQQQFQPPAQQQVPAAAQPQQFQPPAQQQVPPAAQAPWGQQQLPAAPTGDIPPWEQEQPPAQAPWGQQ